MKSKNTISHNKLRGGFYTPKIIVDFLLKWGINENSKYDILEPSCGDGIFIKQLKNNNYIFNTITAIEIDNIEYEKLKDIDIKNSKFINTDFHSYCNETFERFDLIIGNPPYIRFQYFDKLQQDEAIKIFNKANLKYSKLSNAWASFIVGSSLLLKEKGKIGFVIPFEILQVNFAKPIINFLKQFFNKINIICFKKLTFSEIQQDVVLLMCEKNNNDICSINYLDLNDINDLLLYLEPNKLFLTAKKINLLADKWNYYFLNQDEINFIEEIAVKRKIPLLNEYANVTTGINTGANKYFIVNKNLIDKYGLNNFVKPMIGRSKQIDSVIYKQNDWVNNDKKTSLLIIPSKKEIVNEKGVISYINLGESLDIHKGYKTSIRKDWFVLPSIKKSSALFIRRNNLYPRLILNEAEVYNTDTIHRVNIKNNVNKNAFVASFYNSVSLMFSEIFGRNYGGGVLELLPSEVGKIFLPYCNENENLLFIIDQMMREKKDINEILLITNKKILKDNYNFTDNEIIMADNIWKKLIKRRINKK